MLRLPHPSSQLFPPLALRVKRPLASCPWGWVLAESLPSKLHLSVGRKLAGLAGGLGNAHPGMEAPFEIHERGRLASAIKCSSGAHFPSQPIGRSWSRGPTVALSRQGSWGVQASLCWKESVSAHPGDARPSSEPQGQRWSLTEHHLTRDGAIPQAPP